MQPTSNFKRLLLVFVLYASSHFVHGQIASFFSDFQQNESILNPSAISFDSTNLLVLNKQSSSAYKSKDQIFLMSYSGVLGQSLKASVQFFSRKNYVNKNNVYTANFSYSITLRDELQWAVGLRLGIESNQFDYGNLSIMDESDPMIGSDFLTRNTNIIGFGSMLYNDRFTLGFSMPNLIRPKNTLFIVSVLPVDNFQLHGSYSFPISDTMFVKTSFLGDFNQTNSVKYYSGVTFGYREKFHLSYTLSDFNFSQFSTSLYLHLGNRYAIGYVYDNFMSLYRTASHQFSLRISFSKDLSLSNQPSWKR